MGAEAAAGSIHLLLGGNVHAAKAVSDPAYAALEHEINTRAASITIDSVQAAGETLVVSIAVKAEMVGHYLPSMETHDRYWWIQVGALDAEGKRIAITPRPRSEEDFESPSPILFRCTEEPKPECDTLLRPQTTRIYKATLALPKGARPAALDAELHLSIDDQQPVAVTRKPYAPAGPQPDR